jgi:hypothetical protein
MTITYLAERTRDGEFYCYDVIADGEYFHLFLPNGSPLSIIEQYAQEYLDDPFPDSKPGDSVSVVSGSLTAPEPETNPILITPTYNPDVVLRLTKTEEGAYDLEGVEDLLF